MVPSLFLDLDEDLRRFRVRGFFSPEVSLLSSARAAKWLSEGDLASSSDFFLLGGFVATAVPGVLRIDLVVVLGVDFVVVFFLPSPLAFLE